MNGGMKTRQGTSPEPLDFFSFKLNLSSNSSLRFKMHGYNLKAQEKLHSSIYFQKLH